MTLQTNNGFGNSSKTTDAIDHGNDLFDIWTSPQLIQTTNYATGAVTSSIQDSPSSKVVPVYLADLENPNQMSAGLKSFLAGLTAADFEAIASADPWHSNRNFDPTTLPNRFALQRSNQNLVIAAASTSSEDTPQTIISLASSNQDTYIHGVQENAQVQVLYGCKVSFIADGGFQGGVQFDYQYQKLSGRMTGTQFGATATLSSQTLCYTQLVDAWLDQAFNTYAFTAGASNIQCGTQADVVQLVAQGVPVIAGTVTTPAGTLAAGVEVDAIVATSPPQMFRGVTQSDGTFAFTNGIPVGAVTATSAGKRVSLTAVPGAACQPGQTGAFGNLNCAVDRFYAKSSTTTISIPQNSFGYASLAWGGAWVAPDSGAEATFTISTNLPSQSAVVTYVTSAGATLQLNPPLGTALGTYSVTVTAKDGASGVSHSLTVPVDVTPCVPNTCPANSCGTLGVSNGCGGPPLTCGQCGSGMDCSENICCPLGQYWDSVIAECIGSSKGVGGGGCKGSTCK